MFNLTNLEVSNRSKRSLKLKKSYQVFYYIAEHIVTQTIFIFPCRKIITTLRFIAHNNTYNNNNSYKVTLLERFGKLIILFVQIANDNSDNNYNNDWW